MGDLSALDLDTHADRLCRPGLTRTRWSSQKADEQPYPYRSVS